VEQLEEATHSLTSHVATNLRAMADGMDERAGKRRRTGESLPQMVEEAVVVSEEDEDWERANGHYLNIWEADHIREYYNEWHGRGKFEGIPISGGLAGCEERYKARWRRHFSSAEQKRFSRISILVKGMDAAEGGALVVMQDWQRYYEEKKCKLGGLVTLLQEKGYLAKKKGRKKRQSP